MTSLKILVFVGSVRTGRMVERVKKFVQKIIENQRMQPIFIDPISIGPSATELNRTPLHFYANPDVDAPSWLKNVDECIRRANGFIVLSSEYNCGVPPALSNLLNSFPPSSFRHRPVGIITYSMGNFGGVRVLSVLRPYLNELGMITVPAYATFPNVQESLDEDGVCREGIYLKGVEKVVKEVQWYGKAIRAHLVNHPLPV